MAQKFHNVDRHRLISKIEVETSRRFEAYPGKYRLLKDECGDVWVIIGGVDGWQDITANDIDAVSDAVKHWGQEATFVFGHWNRGRVDVYRASIARYLDRPDWFHHMQLVADGKSARIKGTEFRMEKWFDFIHSDAERESQRGMDRAGKVLADLTDEQLRKLAAERGFSIDSQDGDEDGHT